MKLLEHPFLLALAAIILAFLILGAKLVLGIVAIVVVGYVLYTMLNAKAGPTDSAS